jgi:hypothetical protein
VGGNGGGKEELVKTLEREFAGVLCFNRELKEEED